MYFWQFVGLIFGSILIRYNTVLLRPVRLVV
jgi:hypothetical protein